MWIIIIVVCNLPFRRFQKREWSHTLLNVESSLACYFACQVATTIYIMRVFEFSVSKEFCFVCIPINEFIAIPFPVPDYVDREVVFLLFLIINLHTLVFSQCNKGVTCYIGKGIQILGNGFAIVVCYSTFTSTKYFASKVGCIHINMCVASYLCQVATAIDIAIYIWSHLG